MRLLASELRKIRTTWAMLIYVAILVALLVLIVVATLLTTDDDELGAREIRDLFSAATVTTIFSLLLGILLFTTEFRHGTAAQTFLVTPRRERVVGAKTVVGLAVGALFAFFALGVIAAMTVPWLAVRDVPLDLWDGDLVALYLTALGTSALWGALGVGLGGAVRSQVAAVVGALIFLFVVENLVFGLLPEYGRWLPGIATNALIDPTIEEDLSKGLAWAVTLAWVGGFVALAVGFVRVRDVT
jgi:ABC-2 type transport system permease protein